VGPLSEVTRERAQSFLADDHIQRIVAAYHAFADEDGFARVVGNDEIREKGCCIRDGERTRKADAGTIRDIVMRHQTEPERWERRFSLADIDADVDFGEVQAAVADAQQVRRAFFRDMTRPVMVLEDLAVARYGHLTNAGDVLFAANPAIRLPQTRIRATRYNSDKAGDTFSDMKSFEGPLHTVFEEAYSFIVRNTPTISRFIKGNPKRQDSPL